MFPKPVPRVKARKPLKRKTRLKARGKTSHARRPRDTEYMGEVAKLPCIVRELVPFEQLVRNGCLCGGRVQVDHAFGRYVPDADRKTIPLCKEHHEDKTGRVGGGGFMAGWSIGRRRGWLSIAVVITQEAVRAIAETRAALG